LTFTETLSRVITSCGGTSIVIVRRLTFTILSMNGIRSTRPGPVPSPPGLKIALVRRPKPEDHAPLVLAEDAERGEEM